MKEKGSSGTVKRVLLVLEGMADEPVEVLDRKTPLEVAKTPNLNALAQESFVGRLRLADSKLKPSHEVSCLGVLGYEPGAGRSARGPLAAAAIGLKPGVDEWLLSCRLVTTLGNKLIDSNAGGIGGRESSALFESLNRAFKDRDIHFYPGEGSTHVLSIRAEEHYAKFGEVDLRAPDEMIGRELWGSWSKSGAGARLKAFLTEVAEILEAHEINKVRVDLNENPANALWVWGAGKTLHLEPFPSPVSTLILSSSDVWKGAARCAGIEWAEALKTAKPEPSDLAELASRLISRTKSHDLVILHLDEADRAGVEGEYKKKIRWIEAFDQYLVGALRERAASAGASADTRIAVVSGHVTATDRKERTSSEAPCLLWGGPGAQQAQASQPEFSEESAARGAKVVTSGSEFLKKILE